MTPSLCPQRIRGIRDSAFRQPATLVSPVTYKTRSPALDNKNLPLRITVSAPCGSTTSEASGSVEFSHGR